MKDLNSQIDSMFREKIYHVLGENASRIQKLNIRYTKSNKKYSPEHLDAISGSFERAIKEIPRELLRIEKSTRLKYLVPLDDKRRQDIIKIMTTDVEMLIEKITREYRLIFKDHQLEEEFDGRIKVMLKLAQQKIDEGIGKTVESINEKLNSSQQIQPEKLAGIYNLDESTLIDLKAIEPLQTVHEVLGAMPENQNAELALEGIRQAVLLCAKFGTQIEIDPKHATSVEARRFKKMSLIAGTLALKDLIYTVYVLVQQLDLPVEKRNDDIISKIIAKLKESLSPFEGDEKVLECLDPFIQMLSIPEKCK